MLFPPRELLTRSPITDFFNKQQPTTGPARPKAEDVERQGLNPVHFPLQEGKAEQDKLINKKRDYTFLAQQECSVFNSITFAYAFLKVLEGWPRKWYQRPVRNGTGESGAESKEPSFLDVYVSREI